MAIKKKRKGNAKATKTVTMISSEAKKIYKDGKKSGMKWINAIRKASANLKRQGKI